MRLKSFITKRVKILEMTLKSNRIICITSPSYNFVEIEQSYTLMYIVPKNDSKVQRQMILSKMVSWHCSL